MLPRNGAMMPEMVFRMLVLPAPLLPSTVAIWPRRTCRLIPRMALIGPQALSTFCTLSIGAWASAGRGWMERLRLRLRYERLRAAVRRRMEHLRLRLRYERLRAAVRHSCDRP